MQTSALEAAARPRLFHADAPAAATPQRRRLLLACAAALASGCALRPPAPGADADGWHEVRLPGKTPTVYRREPKEGRAALAAHAQRSASLWRRQLDIPPERIGDVAFSWWVDQLIDGARVEESDRGDAVARVMFGFDGDMRRLSARNRMLFDLAHAVTGETPPFATLSYVFETRAPVESVLVGPRTDRMRKIVLDSGPGELRRWRDHRRHLARDFRKVFGEPPGRLISVALMTDTDNTGAVARTWYGPVRLIGG